MLWLVRTLLPNLGGLLLLFCMLLASNALEGRVNGSVTPVAEVTSTNCRRTIVPVHATRLIRSDGDQVRLVQQMPIEVASSTLQTASGGDSAFRRCPRC
jgi:hypothetical protein